jgi:flagellar hook-associated protein 1 FlgK
MSGLMGLLSLAARSLDAQRFGLDVVGQNISNVNTDGYSKRVAQFSAVPPADQWSGGGGVAIDGVRSMRDRLIDRRLWAVLTAEQREAAINQQLSVADVAIGAPGQSVDAALDDFFDAFATLANTPTSQTARQEVILQGQRLASAFRDTAVRLSTAQRDTDLHVRSAVDQVNELTARIADLNVLVTGLSATSPEGLHLRDQINQAVEQLSGLLDINVIETEGGGFNVDFAGGHPLVIGQFSYPVDIQDAGVTGFARVSSGGDDVTAQVTGGALGGLLEVRDAKLTGYLSRLDQLALDVATKVNEVHAAGYGLAGSTGVAFFEIGSPAGALSLSVNASMLAAGGTNLVAASGSATVAGENSNARLLADVRNQNLASGSTASDAWAQLVYRVGRDRQAAASAERTQSEVTQQMRNLQDGASGVSLDEEAADLMRFQRAYEANARFFTTVDETLATLLNMVGA